MTKYFWQDFWFYFWVLFSVWPWLIGSVDMLGIFFVNHTVTGIVWTDGKMVFAAVYPIMCLLMFAGMFS